MREDWVREVIETIFDKLENGKDINQGWSPQCLQYPSQSEDIWGVLKTTAIQKNEFWDYENKELPKDKEVRSHLEVKVGDILLTCAGPRNRCGIVCTVEKTRPKLLLSGKMYRFRPDQRIVLTKFLTYFFQTQEAWLAIDKMKTGISDSGLNLTHSRFRKLLIPIAPLPIQKAIVKKIEELFSSLDSGIADLQKAQEQLVIYRQAVLKKAFEGELTKEWRERQTDLPTAEELLKQIKEERKNHYDRQIEDWKIAVKLWEKNGKIEKKPSSISKPKTFPEVKLSDIENYDAIPSSWYWTRFGTITYRIGDIDHKMPKTVEEGFPYVSTGNIGKDGKINFDKAKLISKNDFDRLALKIKPEKGDIIFPRYGTIGRNILIDYDKEFLVSYSCAIVKNITKIMDERFALYYSLSSMIKREIKRYVVETTQANIGISSIENFVYPLCSKEEQTQIVREIESRLSICDKVEESLKESLEKAKALRQSILKKAFEGKLLSAEEIAKCKADKDYEPAASLLAKIKAEKKKSS